MKELDLTTKDVETNEIGLSELQPSVLGHVSELTRSAPSGGSDLDTIIWSDED
jgi:hypothetical protein